MKYILSAESVERIKKGDTSPLSCCQVLLIPSDIVWRELGNGFGWVLTVAEKASYFVRNTGNFLVIDAGDSHPLTKTRRGSVDGINQAIIEYHMRYGI